MQNSLHCGRRRTRLPSPPAPPPPTRPYFPTIRDEPDVAVWRAAVAWLFLGGRPVIDVERPQKIDPALQLEVLGRFIIFLRLIILVGGFVFLFIRFFFVFS